MRFKRYIIFILLVVAFCKPTYSQQIKNTAQGYLRVEAAGTPGSQLIESSKGKFTNILVSGGFVSIHPTEKVIEQAAQLYNRSFFKVSGSKGQPQQPVKKNDFISLYESMPYLIPGQEYIIELLDKSTDTLVSRYTIKRQKLIPEVKFYNPNNSNNSPFYILNSKDNRSVELSLSDSELRLEIAKRADFKELEVEYTLRNLKTRKSTHATSKTGFSSLKLTANTAYELKINYVVQKESVSTIYLQVKPHWYQSTLTYLIMLIVLAAIVITVIIFVLKKKINSSQKEKQKMEQAAIRLQSLLNPHFTFNALSSIQGLMNTDRIDEANLYLQEFSSLLRQTLAKSQQVFNSLDQELDMMRMYMRLEAFRFNFSWDIEIDSKLNPSVIEIPTLLLQPLIENAIKHGLAKLGNKGQLLIICKEGQKKNTFVIIVKDNGTWVDRHANTGYGLSLTEERIATINKITKEQTIVLNFNKETGTEAILTFHNWINN